jgi:polyisoprenyl-phosphate glycosyltransferase
MHKSQVLVSVIVSVTDAAQSIGPRLSLLSKVLSSNFQYYEIIVVDNASTDGTPGLVGELQRREKNIQCCVLARRRNDNVALTVGLDRAIGDFAVLMDLVRDPPELLPDLVALATHGAEIVYALPRERLRSAGLYNRIAGMFLSFVARLNQVDLPRATSTYRVLSRSVLNYVLESADHHRILDLAPALSGYPYKSLEYDRLSGAGGNERSVGRNALYKALDLMFSSSVRPLRFVTLMSLGICVLIVIYAIYVVAVTFILKNIANGWVSLSLQISGLFFLVCIVLAVMSEYLLQVLEATKRRAPYHVSSESYSSTMDYKQDLNVVGSDALVAGTRLRVAPRSNQSG